MENKFIPRKFIALRTEFGYDDSNFGVFKVKSLQKDKVYEESNPAYIQGNQKGVVIDDNSCWWHYGTASFNARFKEVSNEQ